MNAARNELIDELVADLTPMRGGALVARLSAGILSGGVVASAAMIAWLGMRPDFMVAIDTPSFWIKFVYTALLVVAGAVAVERLARPGESGRAGALLAIACFAGVALLALGQFVAAAGRADLGMLFGRTASFCPLAIVILSVPIFLGAVWALRGLGPTRLTRAGAGAGLLAGAFAAFIYSFSCDETSVAFLASWYTLGAVIAGSLGALSGRLLLRW